MLLLASFGLVLSFGLLKMRVRDYDLLQKAKMELKGQPGDAIVTAGASFLMASSLTKKEHSFYFFLPWLVLVGVLVFGGVKLAKQMEASIALDTRLDICAVTVITKREQLYEFLTKTNVSLKALPNRDLFSSRREPHSGCGYL